MQQEQGTGGGDADGHVIDRLPDYFSGAGTEADDLAIDAHLLHCAACRAEFDELGAVALLLASQPEGTLEADGPAPAATAGGPRSISPAGRDSTRPGSGRRDRGPRHVRLRQLAGHAMVLLVGAALGVGVWAAFDRWPTTPSLENADAFGYASPGQLLVTVKDTAGGGAEVRAAVVGLRPGREFQVVAVDRQGQGHLVAKGMADGGPQSIVGPAPVAASEIAFVVVVESGNGVLLVARPG